MSMPRLLKAGLPPQPHMQRGASLIVVLILLLVVTLLGLAALRTTILQERMSANLFDRSLSFQAAETALREGQVAIQNGMLSTSNPASITGVVNCDPRSEEHTSELQSLMRNSYAFLCLKKQKTINI